jgi:hypothetical protein
VTLHTLCHVQMLWQQREGWGRGHSLCLWLHRHELAMHHVHIMVDCQCSRDGQGRLGRRVGVLCCHTRETEVCTCEGRACRDLPVLRVDAVIGWAQRALPIAVDTCSEPRIHRSNQVTIRCCDQRASCPKTGQHPLTPVSIFRAFPDSHALFDNPSEI